MSKPQVTPEAHADLFEIWDYIHSESGTDAANKVLATIYDAILKIAEVPGGGHFREDVADRRIRFWGLYSYLIAYRWEVNPIQIIAVVHGARDLVAFFEDRL